MVVVKFGRWGVKGTPKYQYARLGYLFGRIPIPLCHRRRMQRYNAQDNGQSEGRAESH